MNIPGLHVLLLECNIQMNFDLVQGDKFNVFIYRGSGRSLYSASNIKNKYFTNLRRVISVAYTLH